MAGRLLRTVASWLGAPFQPSLLPLTLVLLVLFVIMLVDIAAWIMVLDTPQYRLQQANQVQ
jgi:hypothetical protein